MVQLDVNAISIKTKLKSLFIFLMNRDEPTRHVAENISIFALALFSLVPLPLAIYGFILWFTNPAGPLATLAWIGAVMVIEFYLIKLFARRG